MKYCFAPFKTLSIRNDSIGSVCCASNTTFDTIDWSIVKDNQYFAELQVDTLSRNPKGCEACLKKQLNGLPSRKQYFDGILTNNIEHELEHIEINLTNYCNYSCIMCSSKFSSQWNNISDYFTKPYKLSEQSINQIIKLVENNPVKYIDIQGGEPFFINDTNILLQKLIDIGYKGKILIVTNGSKVNNNNILKLIEKLNLEITVSIDTVNSNLYKVIRSPNVDVKVIKQNIKILSNYCNVFINSIMMNLNAYTLYDTVEFAESLGKQLNLNWINRPNYLQVNVLNNKQKQHTVKLLNNIKSIDTSNLIKAIEQPTDSRLIDQFNNFYLDYCSKKNIDPSLWSLWNI